MKKCVGSILMVAMISLAPPVSAASMPQANKMIALISAANCDFTRLKPKLEAAGRAMAANRRTSRVILDLPADPENNLDLMGRPSAFAAALEVSAKPKALRKLAPRLKILLGDECPVGIYPVNERRLMITPRTWPLGGPSPVAKAMVTLVRKQGVPFETFANEWRGPHAMMALDWRSVSGGNGHYVQNLIVGQAVVGEALDGIGESEVVSNIPSLQEREARIKTAAHAATFQELAASKMIVVRPTFLKDEADK